MVEWGILRETNDIHGIRAYASVLIWLQEKRQRRKGNARKGCRKRRRGRKGGGNRSIRRRKRNRRTGLGQEKE